MKWMLTSALLVVCWMFASGCGGRNIGLANGANSDKKNTETSSTAASGFRCSGVATPLSVQLPVRADFSVIPQQLSAQSTVKFTCNDSATVAGNPTAAGGGSFGNYSIVDNSVTVTGTFQAHGTQKVTMQFSERARPANIVTATALVNVAPVADTLSCNAAILGGPLVKINNEANNGSPAGKSTDAFTLSVGTSRTAKIVSVTSEATGATLSGGTTPTTTSQQFSIPNYKISNFAGGTALLVTVQDAAGTATAKCRAPVGVYMTGTTVQCTNALTNFAAYTPVDPTNSPVGNAAAVDIAVATNQNNSTIVGVTGHPGLKFAVTNLTAKIEAGPVLGVQGVVIQVKSGTNIGWCGYTITSNAKTPDVSGLPTVRRFYSDTHKDHFLTTDAAGPDSSWGLEGTSFSLYAAKSVACNVEVWACHLTAKTTQHFVSPDADCEGETKEKVLGYACAFPAQGLSKVMRGESSDANDHLSTIDAQDLATFLSHAGTAAAPARDQTVPYYVPGSHSVTQRIGP